MGSFRGTHFYAPLVFFKLEIKMRVDSIIYQYDRYINVNRYGLKGIAEFRAFLKQADTLCLFPQPWKMGWCHKITSPKRFRSWKLKVLARIFSEQQPRPRRGRRRPLIGNRG